MDTGSVVDLVIDVIRQVQGLSGRAAGGMEPDTRPFKDVEGFDSLSGIEATLLLSETLGQELPDSVFVPSEGGRVLSIKEIAENACKYVSTGNTYA